MTYFYFGNFILLFKIYEIAKYAPKLDFLIKFLEINNDTHTLNFNFKEYDSFDIKSWMNNMKKFSEKSLSKEIDLKKLDESVPDLPKTSISNMIKRNHTKRRHEKKSYSSSSSHSSKSRKIRKKSNK